MVGLSAMLEAAVRGLRVHVEADRLVIRGPRQEERRALELLASKGEVVSYLRAHPELADLDGFTAKVMLTFGGELLPDDEKRTWDEGVAVERVLR